MHGRWTQESMLSNECRNLRLESAMMNGRGRHELEGRFICIHNIEQMSLVNKLKGATYRSMKSPSRRNIRLRVHESGIPTPETLASKVLIGNILFVIARIILPISLINFVV